MKSESACGQCVEGIKPLMEPGGCGLGNLPLFLQEGRTAHELHTGQHLPVVLVATPSQARECRLAWPSQYSIALFLWLNSSPSHGLNSSILPFALPYRGPERNW